MTVSVEVVASAAVVGGGVRDVVVAHTTVNIAVIGASVGGRGGGDFVIVFFRITVKALNIHIVKMIFA